MKNRLFAHEFEVERKKTIARAYKLSQMIEILFFSFPYTLQKNE